MDAQELLKLLDNNNTQPTKQAENTADSVEINGVSIPEPFVLSDIWNTEIKLAPERIGGVLRQGHKMILTAPSKAGKTFCMMELAVAIASGGEWLGFQCSKGKVLYVNFELSAESCYSRFLKIGTALKLTSKDAENITVWNLRGYNVPFEHLALNLAVKVKGAQIDLVILDPIYKCFSGSENEQEAVTRFCNCVDLIAEAGASVIYTHHHSKGIQGNKSSIDRGSGSGVFARDADAILDMIEVNLPGERQIDPNSPNVTAWQLEGVLREFAPFKPKKLYFRYPLHVVCNDGALDDAKPRTSNQRGGNARGAQMQTKKAKNMQDFLKAFDEMSADLQPVKIKALADCIGVDDKTARRYAADIGGFVISQGTIKRV